MSFSDLLQADRQTEFIQPLSWERRQFDVLTVIATLEEFNQRRRGEMESNSNNRFSRKVRRTEPLEPGRYTLEVKDVGENLEITSGILWVE